MINGHNDTTIIWRILESTCFVSASCFDDMGWVGHFDVWIYDGFFVCLCLAWTRLLSFLCSLLHSYPSMDLYLVGNVALNNIREVPTGSFS